MEEIANTGIKSMGEKTTGGTFPEIKWPVEHNLPSLPVNQFAIAQTGDFVYLTFGEVRPLGVGATEDQLREHGPLFVEPHASVVVTPNGHKALTFMLLKALDKEGLAEALKQIQEQLEEKVD